MFLGLNSKILKLWCYIIIFIEILDEVNIDNYYEYS